MISCSCGEFDGDGCYINTEKADFYFTDKQKKCDACGKKVPPSEIIWDFPCYELGEDGKDIYASSFQYCEICGDMFMNLIDLDFCFDFEEDPVRQWQGYRKDMAYFKD